METKLPFSNPCSWGLTPEALLACPAYGPRVLSSSQRCWINPSSSRGKNIWLLLWLLGGFCLAPRIEPAFSFVEGTVFAVIFQTEKPWLPYRKVCHEDGQVSDIPFSPFLIPAPALSPHLQLQECFKNCGSFLSAFATCTSFYTAGFKYFECIYLPCITLQHGRTIMQNLQISN